MKRNVLLIPDLLEKKEFISFALTCLSQNLLELAQPVLINLDPESVTSLVKGLTLKSLPRLLEFLDNQINQKGSCPKMFYFLGFLRDLTLYQYEQIKEHKVDRKSVV